MNDKTESKRGLENLSNKSVILTALCTTPLLFLFAYLGDPAKGRAAALCGCVVLLCARSFWDLRKRALFWLALIIAACCQVPIVMRNPWGSGSYPGIVLLPLALPDFAIVYGLFKLVEKLTRTDTQTADTNTGM